MSIDRVISIKEACELLGVSRPTFDAYRKKYRFSETKKGRQIFFSQTELLDKVPPKGQAGSVSLIVLGDQTVDELLIKDTVFDLRRINLIDPHGVISLLCSVLTKAEEGKTLHLLVRDDFQIQRLHSLGFFHEIERKCPRSVLWDKSKLRGLSSMDTDTFLPIQFVGHKGGERQSSEDLIRLLIKHGFSEEIGARIGWIFGELADNALTHGKGPCYLMCQRFVSEKKEDVNYLVIAVADMGVGIHNSLRTNPKYEDLDDIRALVTAFKPSVTSWPDEHKRGKGLADVIKISLGNKSYFRVASGSVGFTIPWEKEAVVNSPMTLIPGTRYSIVLTDGEFRDVAREEADKYVDGILKRL